MILEQEILALQKLESAVKAKKELVDASLKEQRELFSAAKTSVELYNKCTQLLIDTSLAIQEKTTSKIAQIVTSLYQAVFQNKDEFVIKVDTKRKTPVAEFLLKTTKGNQEVLIDPVEADGGGKLDVIALGLRLAALLLYKPDLNKVLILDEPMRFISSNTTSEFPYRRRAVAFLKDIAKTYGIQIIAVTHDVELIDMADKHYEFSLDKDGFTEAHTKCY